VIGISAGNHAQALAWGAAAEGLDALLVMWQGASEAKIGATRGYGAEVDLERADPTEAFERLDELIEQTGRTLVHPFDHPRTIRRARGRSGSSCSRTCRRPDVVVVPVGGGGLIAGIATRRRGARARGRRRARRRSRAMHAALEALRAGAGLADSIADGLGRAVRRHDPFEIVLRARRERSCSSRRPRSRRRCGSCTPREASRASQPEPRHRRPPGRKGALEQGDTVVAVVSGGNGRDGDRRQRSGRPMTSTSQPARVDGQPPICVVSRGHADLRDRLTHTALTCCGSASSASS
jgi:hypothetical protein